MADNIDVENMDVPNGVTDDDKLWALLAYVFTPLVPVIILLLEDKKNRPFIRSHNVQALIWGILSWVIGSVTSFLFCIPGLILWALALYWGWQAYQGKQVEIPFISNFVRQQGWA
jgi:uncharacterized membrane protein